MPLIHILQPNIANQIAAGEVVERPASVVKELVENAIDAGSTAISVEIENGGMRSIRVTDNGCGIPKEECQIAFLRHATSKITAIEDLSHIATLGFRGEALASIASVSRVTMHTRTAEADTGTRLVIENGEVISQSEAACVYGTAILVEALFASVPARLKFLKSARTEAGYVGDYMARIILARPDISFRFSSDGKIVYETYGDRDLFNSIYCVYGKNVSEKMVPVAFDNGYLKVTGYIGLPEISRSNRTYQTLLLNGRYIRSNSISASVLQAYDTRLMIGRFPFFVLCLTIAPAEYDINVHPAKMEVRFAEEQRVCGAVHGACSQALSQTDQHVQSALETCMPKDAARPAPDSDPVTGGSGFYARALPAMDPVLFREKYPSYGKGGSNDQPMLNTFKRIPVVNGNDSVPSFQVPSVSSSNDKQDVVGLDSLVGDSEHQIIGCIFHSYWIIEREEDMFLIDQHAAHERFLFDRLSAREIPMASQALLVPYEIRLTPSEADALQSFRQDLEELGYAFDHVGSLTVSVKSVPVLNGVQLRESYLHEALEIFIEYGSTALKHMVSEKLMQSACKHAVKAGEPLQKEEIEELLSLFVRGEIPLTCPHGRPVIIRIRKTELDKMFRRIV